MNNNEETPRCEHKSRTFGRLAANRKWVYWLCNGCGNTLTEKA